MNLEKSLLFTFSSSSSFLVHIDENGDAAGNYTVLGVKLISDSNTNTSTYGLFPFGTFIARSNAENGSQSIPVSYENLLEASARGIRLESEFKLH